MNTLHEADLKTGTDNQVSFTSDTEQVLLYESSFGFLISGVVVMFVALLSTLPLLQGCRYIGRDVSLSPIETAAALRHTMGEPAIQAMGLVEADKLVKKVGRTRVLGHEEEPHGDGDGCRNPGVNEAPLSPGVVGNAPKETAS
jgi:hypothetical protein